MTTMYMPTHPDGTAHILSAADREIAQLLKASPRDTAPASTLQRTGADIMAALSRYDQRAQELSTNPNLSAQGRAQQLQPLQETLHAEIRGPLNRAEETVEQLKASAAWTPPDLTDDPSLQEQQLQTARLDAAMMLDSVPEKDLPDALRDIAQDPDTPAPLRHLLLFTNWPAMFMRGKGIHPTTRDSWARYQELLQPDALPEASRTAYRRHRAVQRHAPKIAFIIRSAADFALADRGAGNA
jgi:hypothetical protein